jgi:hypothetical protein
MSWHNRIAPHKEEPDQMERPPRNLIEIELKSGFVGGTMKQRLSFIDKCSHTMSDVIRLLQLS